MAHSLRLNADTGAVWAVNRGVVKGSEPVGSRGSEGRRVDRDGQPLAPIDGDAIEDRLAGEIGLGEDARVDPRGVREGNAADDRSCVASEARAIHNGAWLGLLGRRGESGR